MEVLVGVNPRKCMASQNCVMTASDIFELGSAGYSRVKREVTEADLDSLKAAEAGCPANAIRVETSED